MGSFQKIEDQTKLIGELKTNTHKSRIRMTNHIFSLCEKIESALVNASGVYEVSSSTHEFFSVSGANVKISLDGEWNLLSQTVIHELLESFTCSEEFVQQFKFFEQSCLQLLSQRESELRYELEELEAAEKLLKGDICKT